MISTAPVNLVYLHGLGSAGDSQTAQALRLSLPVEAVRIVAPGYAPHDPEATVPFLDQTHEDVAPTIVVGTSLGGYWAIRYGERFPKTKILAINPTLNPIFSLAKRRETGFTDYASGAQVPITKEMLAAFRPVSAPALTMGEVDLTLIRGLMDDVIPIETQREMTRSLNLENVPAHEFEMGHRADPNLVLPIVREILDRCV